MYLYMFCIHIHSCILVYPCMQTSAYTCTCYVHIHAYIYTCTHKNISMDTYIYETMRYNVYCLKFHPIKTYTYRLTYCFPLHLISWILSVVFIELFNKLALFKLLWNLIPSLEALIE